VKEEWLVGLLWGGKKLVHSLPSLPSYTEIFWPLRGVNDAALLSAAVSRMVGWLVWFGFGNFAAMRRKRWLKKESGGGAETIGGSLGGLMREGGRQ
jgi:hypothetical protein